MKISASVYSQQNKSLPDLIKELDKHRINLFHIDCNDDASVFNDIEEIKKISSTPIDLHIISSQPEKYFDEINRLNIEHVTFQYEQLKNRIPFKSYLNAEIGLSIVSQTPSDVFDEYLDDCSFILFMTTTPGKSGGVFNKENFSKIRRFKKNHSNISVHVDGGVNAEVSFILRNMGVDTAVVGSYLFNQDYIGEALINLKSEKTESHVQLNEFMIELDELPVISYNKETKLIDILKSIDNYALGFSIVTDDAGKLNGIISNADIRKGLIKNYHKINEIGIEEVINKSPFYMRDNSTVNDLLEYIKKQNFPVLYIPLVNENNKLTGALTFNNLIKGES